MIDKNLLIDDIEYVITNLARRGIKRDIIENVSNSLVSLRANQQILDDKRYNLKNCTSKIAKCIREGNKEELDRLKEEVITIKKNIDALVHERELLDKDFNDSYLNIPNLPSKSCPDGKDESDNVVIKTRNYNPESYNGSYKTHWEIGERLDIYDPVRAAKISGSMFSILKNKGARLLRALINFAMDLHREKYVEIVCPHLVNTATFFSTGHLPKFEDDSYKIEGQDMWLIPTGEVSLTAMHRGETFKIDELPKSYMAHTSCFRKEAGHAGKDTRGMQRLHEFHKVELVTLSAEEDIASHYRDMLSDVEKMLIALKLPYRIVDLCAGDLTFSSSRIHDFEVYSPGLDAWLEVSSVGRFDDFQSRRGNMKYKTPDNKRHFVHCINGSAMATPRIWIAILENFQQQDGTIAIPEVLIPYTGFNTLN